MTRSTTDDHALTEGAVQDLYRMLCYMRPDGSEAEKHFIERFLLPLDMRVDGFGNLTKLIGSPEVAWSCHTDTVHMSSGNQMIHQESNNASIIRLSRASKANCLGADDTAGVWLMREMIKANVPGLYLFHRGEERGGKGSRWLAKETPELLKDTKCVIALDRKGYDSVITHQFGGRCCSEDFSKSIAEGLKPLQFKSDSGGTFTDSASYTDLVGECTNLSVGYRGQHSKSEDLSLFFLAHMRLRLIELATSKLVYKRKAGEKDLTRQYGGWASEYGQHGAYHDGGYGNHYGRRFQEPDPDDLRNVHNDDYCPSTFYGHYWKDGKMVKCTIEAWKIRSDEVDKIMADKRKAKKALEKMQKAAPQVEDGATKKPYFIKNGVRVYYNMATLVDHYPDDVAAALAEWGFDVEHVWELIVEQISRKVGKGANNNEKPTVM